MLGRAGDPQPRAAAAGAPTEWCGGGLLQAVREGEGENREEEAEAEEAAEEAENAGNDDAECVGGVKSRPDERAEEQEAEEAEAEAEAE